jgi:3-oxoacyl-[acyl-carrier-protein] synthase II
MQKTIWVTGIGVASSMGLNIEESLASFRKKKTGVGNIDILDSIHKSDFKAGEIKLNNQELMQLLKIPPVEYRRHTRTSLIGILAARQAFSDAGISTDDGIQTALISATTVGGMDKTELDYASKNYHSGFIETHPCGDTTDKIADYLGLTGYRTTLNTACSSGANAIMHGARLIKHGIVERAIVGGVDALSKFTLNGFNSLMILDEDYCRPFDAKRKGLNLGEAAGFLVLESEDLPASGKARKICKLSGYANSNDAYHQTASSPDGEGAYSAMSKALAMSGISREDIDYINVHGTGTENNDSSEGAAIIRVFGKEIPPFSSTKPFTGHALGAAAAIEAVFSVLAIQYGMLFPSLGFNQTIEGMELFPVTEVKEGVQISHVLTNSFGFGGNNSSLVFSK